VTEEELKDYAKFLIHSHAQEVEFLSISEMYEEWTGYEDSVISEEDARRVDDLIHEAFVRVYWR
jgi:hypothetical protein